MAKYLMTFTYSKEGVQGLLKDGGTRRRAVVEQLAQSLGARLEAFYFTFGDSDGVLIMEGPDNASAAAASLIVGATGAASVKTTVLLTPEEVDAAAKKSGKYTPPGQ